MLCPEMARSIGEFESSIVKRQDNIYLHHEQREHAQIVSARDLKALRESIKEMENSFNESSSNLLVLDSRNIADTAVAYMVHQTQQLQLSMLKSNCSLFSRLYTTSLVWRSDLDEFFMHENQACPPALTQMGVLKSETK